MGTGWPATDGGIKVKGTNKSGKIGINVSRRTGVLDITVLMGGPSTERKVSLISGAAVADALTRRGHKVTRSDISPQDTSALDRKGIDVVFIVLHGLFGESGDVQQLCHERGLRYTGSPQSASSNAMDKQISKNVFEAAGLKTPPGVLVDKSQDLSAVGKAIDALGIPAVVKPVDGGSSVDVTIARDAVTRDTALATVLGKYGRALVERFIHGREFTVGIVGAQALPIIEIVPARDFYDFTAKYADNSGTQYRFEHGLDERVEARMKSEALAAHKALDCRDMSRVDFILSDDGTPYVLEINTIPGFTGHSLLPMAAAKAGIAMDELVDRIAMMAMER